jgi:SWI/SNF-related matrix-associated actin-dependent regulator 1 of chromatin subfamily A
MIKHIESTKKGYMKSYRHQLEALEFLKERDRALLNLDTGLGKTKVCIDLAEYLGAKCLVICPAFLRLNWQDEIDKWSAGNAEFHVRSYEYFLKDKNVIEAKSVYSLIICDEAHYLKNWGAKRTRNIILKVLTGTRRVVLSTATPYVRSAADLHPLFSVLEPGKWGKFQEFCSIYCEKVQDKWASSGYVYKGFNRSKAGELYERARAFTITVSRNQVEDEMPSKVETILRVQASNLPTCDDAEIQKAINTGIISEQVSALRKAIGLSKLKYACDWITNVFGQTEPIVVFVWHRMLGLALQEMLDANDIKSGIILGGNSFEHRDKTIREFKREDISVLIGTIGAMGAGLNLETCRNALFLELPWSAAETKQCEDRLMRLTQKAKVVSIYKLIVKDSLDEAVLRTIAYKRLGAEATIGFLN